MSRQEPAWALVDPDGESPGRVEDWRSILDTPEAEQPRVPIRSVMPYWARMPGIGRRRVLDVDDARLTAVQRGRIVTVLSARHGVSAEEVIGWLDVEPAVLLADSCTVEVPA